MNECFKFEGVKVLKEATLDVENFDQSVRESVETILNDIQNNGLNAIRKYSEKFDSWSPENFRVDQQTIDEAIKQVSPELKESIEFSFKQVSEFAKHQKNTLKELEVEMAPGVVLGHKLVPVNSVGCYVPGGQYPLIASAIMTIATAKVAGVPRVIACAPPSKEGGIHPAQLYAMVVSGADEIYCIGGVQALGFMAYGTEEVRPVDMIVGAGNAFVAEAKRQLFGKVGIDLLAGPSEVLIIADDTANPKVVAVDLLAQAEHGPTSEVILVTDSEEFGNKVIEEVETRLNTDWPTKDISRQAWENRGQVIVCDCKETVLKVADYIASEHVELQTKDDDWFFERLTNYGSLFIGKFSTVAYGDKGIGTNHVLPTNRASRYTGGLGVSKFLKTLTYQRVSPEGTINVAPHIAKICDAEMMEGHAISTRIRMGNIDS